MKNIMEQGLPKVKPTKPIGFQVGQYNNPRKGLTTYVLLLQND